MNEFTIGTAPETSEDVEDTRPSWCDGTYSASYDFDMSPIGELDYEA